MNAGICTYSAGWFDRLVDADGSGVLQLPGLGETMLRVGTEAHKVRVLSPVSPQVAGEETEIVYWAPEYPSLSQPYPSLHIRPSSAAAGAAIEYDVKQLGPRLRFGGNPDMQLLGEPFHLFFAADQRGDDPSDRLVRAPACISAWTVGGVLTSEDLVVAADRLWRWCAVRWP